MNKFLDFSPEHIMGSLMGLLPFTVYFITAMLMLLVFVLLYTKVTPYCEFTLIREKNRAAALSLGGAIIGFTLPLGELLSSAGSLVDFIIWSVVAIVVQLLTFVIVRIPFPHRAEGIKDGDTSMGISLAGLSIAVGMINAAAMGG